MFKGLRTKIECEQRGQKPPDPEKSQNINIPPNRFEQANNVHSSISDVVVDSASDYASKSYDTDPIDESLPDIEATKNSIAKHTYVSNKIQDTNGAEVTDYRIPNIKEDFIEAENKLQSVIKEKNVSIEENAKLSQIVEQLRTNLEIERETNASLKSKLDELSVSLKERDDMIKSLTGNDASMMNEKPSSGLGAKVTNDDVESLHKQLEQLQNQLSEKTRQIKIRQQNTNDIKKALQKEMMDHSRTQKELNELQNQIRQLQSQNQALVAAKDSAITTNGSNKSDMNLNHRTYLNQISDTQNDLSVAHDESESPNIAQQLDSMSNLSRSGASVEDFDSNDLQHNDSKEVNYEYLKNVLYRYMTTTDTETAQHLVKAISVLMNFNPEQSAAVRSAMHSKTSWLRLK